MSTRRSLPMLLALCVSATVWLPVATAPAAVGAALSGDRLWSDRYDGPANRRDVAYSLALGPDGTRAFVTGLSFGKTGLDYRTIAYDASTGARLWSKRYDGPAHRRDEPWMLAVSPDGTSVFVTGQSDGGASGTDFATIAYDASTGATRWVARMDRPGPRNGVDVARAVAVSPNGRRVFVTGSTDADYLTVALRASNGSAEWVKRFDGPGGGDDYGVNIAVAPDGGEVFVTGGSSNDAGVGCSPPCDYEMATLAYDASTGARTWAARYDDVGDAREHVPHDIAISPDGNTLVVTGRGFIVGFDDLADYATVAYDAATGEEIWDKVYDGGNNTDASWSVAVGPDSASVFVTGMTRAMNGFYDYMTFAYDAETGADSWSQRYNGPGDAGDAALAIAANPDGSAVFVTGTSANASGDLDYATLAYDADTGAPLWVKRYSGPRGGDDGAYDVAVAPDGTDVVVTGESVGARGETDFVTIAYET